MLRSASALTAVLALTAAACTVSSTTPPPLESPESTARTESALEEENGGMSMDDEAPAFGDPSVEAVAPLTPASPDVSDTPGADLPGMRSYHLAILWGHMPSPKDASDADTEPQPIDWTGSVSVDKGAIGVVRTLAFDAKDRLARRSDKSEVSFVSHTLPFVDGLYLRVVVPEGAPQVLHFQTSAMSKDIDLAALATKFVGAERLADGKNGVAFAGYPDVRGCNRGLVLGRWVKARAQLGGFRGRVLDDGGDTIGRVRGIWGHAPKRDEDVFFGKYIGESGGARGLFGGTYGGGSGRGVWATRDPRDVGGLQIAYGDGYDKDDGRGVWLGRWSEKCDR